PSGLPGDFERCARRTSLAQESPSGDDVRLPPPSIRAMSKIAAAALPLFLSLALGSCEAIEPLLPPGPEELDLWADAAAGVTHPELAALCRDVWQADLRHDPFQATALGDPRFHGDIPDTSREGRGAWKAKQRA